MSREMVAAGLKETDQLIEAHRAWTARAFCMATAELRGSFEPIREPERNPRRPSRSPRRWRTEDL